MDEKLQSIFAQVFKLRPGEYTDMLSPDTLPEWDSLGHIRLVTAMEEGFGLTFENEEIMDMSNVAAIKEILVRRGVRG